MCYGVSARQLCVCGLGVGWSSLALLCVMDCVVFVGDGWWTGGFASCLCGVCGVSLYLKSEED